MRSLILLLALATMGCSAPPSPVVVPGEEAAALGEPSVKVTLTEYQVEITSQPVDAEARMVTYIILRPDNDKFNLQLTGTGSADGFPIGLSRKRFYRGHYEIRAHKNSDPSPFATTTWEFTGPSIADDLADGLQHAR